MLWRKNGKLLKDSGGHLTRCNDCPCDGSGGAAPECCQDGIVVPRLYMYWYAGETSGFGPDEANGLCFPLVCGHEGDNFFFHESHGIVNLAFTWNQEEYVVGDLLGDSTGGCTKIRLTGGCVESKAFGEVSSAYNIHMEYDYGDGVVHEMDLDAIISRRDTGTFDGDGNRIFATRCEPVLGCAHAVEPPGSYHVSTYDPAGGIITPTDVIPLDVDVNVTLTDSGGTPTLYTWQLHFAPLSTLFATASTGYVWQGMMDDCSGHCTAVALYYTEDTDDGNILKWFLFATFFGPSSVSPAHALLYKGASLPTSGVSLDNWRACGAHDNPTPMWSLTW